ncbi:hypothetical protein Fcan01_20048 [Folsomia candida]|uniref:Uncharacterized protein n=1 Tax=Folsomia candida TaxID=158441 RepID=A0A226DJZ1_FOLCA|nr:hypothetical protein Fcan01_20048 [Folsomia candida]
MLETIFSRLFRKAVVLSQRSTFHLAYYFEIERKTGCIKPVRNWHYKAFQLIWIVAAFLVLPGFLVRCYLLFTAEEGKEDKMTIFFTAMATGVLVMFVLFASVFIRPEGVGRFKACFETMVVMEQTFLEFLPNPKCGMGTKVTRAVQRCTIMTQLIHMHSFYSAPLLGFLVGCTKSNPLYTMLREIYNFELHHGPIINLVLRIVGGFGFGLGSMIAFSTTGTCCLLIIYCINCLNVWTLFLEPITGTNGGMRLRGGLFFQNAVKIYNTLKIMTIVESNMLRDMLMPYTHHIFAVFFSTAVVVLQRSTFHLAYYFELDKTTGCVKTLKNWRYKGFQLIWIVATFLLSGFLVRCYLLFTVGEAKEEKMTIFFTAMSTGMLVVFILFASTFVRPGGGDNYKACFEGLVVMEKKFLVTRAVEKCTVVIQLICIHCFYTAPFLAFLMGCTKSNPLYATLRAVYNFELHHGPVVNAVLQICSGVCVWVSGTIMSSTIAICSLLWMYSINCLNVWTMFLDPIKGNDGQMRLRGGLLFQNAVKMYNTLKIMSIVESKMLREMLMPWPPGALIPKSLLP